MGYIAKFCYFCIWYGQDSKDHEEIGTEPSTWYRIYRQNRQGQGQYNYTDISKIQYHLVRFILLFIKTLSSMLAEMCILELLEKEVLT